jgi:integrase/recombinase XerC
MELGKRVEIVARPHGLRHAAITTAAEITRGNIVAVKRFSRHRNVRTVMVYVDNYKDEGGEIGKQLAGRVQV